MTLARGTLAVAVAALVADSFARDTPNVGASFHRHAPRASAANVVVEDRSTPATRGLPRVWRRVGSYREPLFVAHLLGAIEMAAGRGPFACAAR